MELNDNNPLTVTDSDLGWPGIHITPHGAQVPDERILTAYPGRIDFSAREQGLSYLIHLIQSTPDIREEKVAKIQREIASSIYSVNAHQIADKIIDGNPIDEV